MKQIPFSESFQWAKELIPILKQFEVSGVAFYQVAASHGDVRNRNGRVYTSKELQNSAASLSERPLNMNHDDSRMLPFPDNQVVAARYESGVVECIIQVADPEVQRQIQSGEINHVSIEGLYLDESNNTHDTEYPTSLHFRALALLTKDDEPGDPDARILRDHGKALFVRGEIKEKLCLKEQGQTATFQTSGEDNVCDICLALEGNTYPASSVPSDQQPPIHPNCNCSLVVSSMDHALKIKKLKNVQGNIQEAPMSQADQNDLPDSAFAYVEPGGKKDSEGKTVPRSLRHLPYKGADGKIDLPHLRNALARLSQTNIPAAAKAEARSTLVAAAKASGINTSMDEALSTLAKATEDYKIARECANAILDAMNAKLVNPAGQETEIQTGFPSPKPQMISNASDDPITNPQSKKASPEDPQDFDARKAVQLDPSDESPQNPKTGSQKTQMPNMTYGLEVNPLAITNQSQTMKDSAPDLMTALKNAGDNTSVAPLKVSEKKKRKLVLKVS